jgi:hypothetical protein
VPERERDDDDGNNGDDDEGGRSTHACRSLILPGNAGAPANKPGQ